MAEAPAVDLASELEPGAVPPWLAAETAESQIEEAIDATADEPPDWTPEAAELELAPAELPDWLVRLDSLDQAGEMVTLQPPAADLGWTIDARESLAQADIPDWLQALRPREAMEGLLEVGAAVHLEPAEEGGPLDGLRGGLMAEPLVTAAPTSRPLPKFVVTEQQQAHAQVLERIVHTGPAAKPPPPATRRVWGWLEQSAIPLLVLLAVLLPVSLGSPLLNLGGNTSVSTTILDTYRLLDSLADDSLVIVAFDYTLAVAGELEPVSTALLEHILHREGRILTVSTTPVGPEIARRVLDELAAERGYVYGDDYLHLGFIPGGAVGLQAFAADPWRLFPGADYMGQVETARNAAAATGLSRSLAEVDLILVLTSERDDLVGWIEQVGRLVGTSKVPIAAGVSASLEPWARPYASSRPRQLSGLVHGIPGAAQYELQMALTAGAESTTDSIRLRDSQAVALIVIILFVDIGLLWGALQALGPALSRRPAAGARTKGGRGDE